MRDGRPPGGRTGTTEEARETDAMPMPTQIHRTPEAETERAPSRAASPTARPGAASLPLACSAHGACPSPAATLHRRAAHGDRGGAYFGGAESADPAAMGDAGGAAAAAVHRTIAGGGEPLDPGTRGFFEGRFGRGLGDVRVHTGADADASARGVDARAYTVGSHVAFRRGEYAPGSDSGRRLLAHELAHTVQQSGASPAPGGPLAVAPADGPGERDADAAANRALAGGAAASPAFRAGAGTLQRQTPTGTPMGTMPAGPVAPATPADRAAGALTILRELAADTTRRRERAIHAFHNYDPIPIHVGYSQQVRAQQSISQTGMRDTLNAARAAYQAADALPGGDGMRVQLRDAYITVLHEVRVTMRESLRMSQQLLRCAVNPANPTAPRTCPRETEPARYVENMALWIEASPMTSTALSGTTSFGAADATAGDRWAAELRAYQTDVAETIPALAAAPPAPAGGGTAPGPDITADQASQASARILAGVRRASLTVGAGPGGTMGPRAISDGATMEGTRTMEAALQPLVSGARPMRLITLNFHAYTLPDPVPAVTAVTLAGNGIPSVDTTHVPAEEVDAVRYAIDQASRTVFDPASTDALRDAWWPVVIPVRRGGAVRMVRYELVFAHDGGVRAERVGDAAPREVSPAFAAMTVAQKKASLVADFGLSGVDDHTATWASSELDALHATLSRMSGRSRDAVRGVSFVRDHVGQAMGGGFTPSGYAHTGTDAGADPAPAIAHRPPHIHIYDNAFTGTGLSFGGAPGDAGAGVEMVIAHEVGHMVFGQTTLAANRALTTSLAALNGILPTTPMPAAALTAFNAWQTAQGAANTAIVAYNNAHNNAAAPGLRATAATAVTARNTARAAMATAGVPAAILTRAAALDAANDALMAAVDQAPNFVAVANRVGFHRFTDYAARQSDEEWFAETHALYVTDPRRLASMSRGMFAWFQAGMPNDATWTP